ncbi:MAG: TrkH family potassium uptake protein [Candidatus Eisenbacteria bacterium]|uniref:TrkH family potassium uptake protein n=1 Tax=Eiseniibacteriota bacterium TaxID=2212470 RepID=A0A948W875_UNCEI|nr:TrkH family potassium uptake protein [Candidatus Eisenbacteria bacterium]MBU1947427.1 TrkH family potassium uptake protein [Candidatus Eisenbacteria bacterium]MBU2693384.1 TrkH family potassium uptake protein [Candidatus Eisenbacteria bacterium]
MMLRMRLLKAHPASIVLASFLLAITVGALILMLPLSTRGGHIDWLDAAFTATSAVCVTGLVVVDTGSYFTMFGQCVILALIQIGGLGVMTISVALFRWLGRSVSIRGRMVMQDLFAHTPRADIFSLIKSVLLFTIGAEVVGAILLSVHWAGELGTWRAMYTAIFHAVSAFCNAGFSLFPDSMVRYSGSALLNLTVCFLIIAGGIGFPVLYDLQLKVLRRGNEKHRLAVQTRAVLLTSAVLIIAGAAMFAVLEGQAHGSQQHSLIHRLMVPLFQSITCRTAGFNTVDIASLTNATLAMMIVLMFFGASPGSCGGGIKTTTLAVLVAFSVGRIRRKSRVNMFKKSIPAETVSRSVALVLVSIGIIGVVLFMMLASEDGSGVGVGDQERGFLALMFETVSAFGTVGLSMGVTPELSAWGKSLIIGMMILGRVGVLTFAYVIVGTGPKNGIEYSEENLMVG